MVSGTGYWVGIRNSFFTLLYLNVNAFKYAVCYKLNLFVPVYLLYLSIFGNHNFLELHLFRNGVMVCTEAIEYPTVHCLVECTTAYLIKLSATKEYLFANDVRDYSCHSMAWHGMVTTLEIPSLFHWSDMSFHSSIHYSFVSRYVHNINCALQSIEKGEKLGETVRYGLCAASAMRCPLHRLSVPSAHINSKRRVASRRVASCSTTK